MAALSNFNLPLLTIPAYYVLAGYPHGHAVLLGSKGDLSQHDNRNPKSSTNAESLKRRLTARELAAFERAESCHRNALENMPLFVAAVFSGLLAEQKAGVGAVRLNTFAAAFMVVRILYTINYLTTETVRMSYVRSLLYFISTFHAFWIIGCAAYVLGQ